MVEHELPKLGTGVRFPSPALYSSLSAAPTREADDIVAHLGTSSTLSAFEAGATPVLVRRRQRIDEHVDAHQVVTAVQTGRGPTHHVWADEPTSAHLAAVSVGGVVGLLDPARPAP
jgi:UDP-N-acetylglucosamine transferase subunit ALG13